MNCWLVYNLSIIQQLMFLALSGFCCSDVDVFPDLSNLLTSNSTCQNYNLQNLIKVKQELFLRKIHPVHPFYCSLEPYCTFGLTSITDVKECILPLAVSNGRWLENCWPNTDVWSTLTRTLPRLHSLPSCISHAVKLCKRWTRLAQNELFVNPLKHSADVDMGLWKYENTLATLTLLCGGLTHNFIILRVQSLPFALYLSNLSCQSHLPCQPHL